MANSIALLKNNQYQQGFTMIELVVVIIILAITSLYASSKFFNTNIFSIVAKQEQILSILRQTQVIAMQNSDGGNACRIINMSSNRFGSLSDICIEFGDNLFIDDLSNERKNTAILTLSYDNFVSSQLYFDFLGRPLDANNNTPLCTNRDCRITLTLSQTNESRSVCINSEGFLYRSIDDRECLL